MTELSANELELIGLCLEAAVYGPFFVHRAAKDPWGEFPILMGSSREEIIEIAEVWPLVDLGEYAIQRAVNNAMLHLLSYPHRCWAQWPHYVPVPPEEVYRVLKKWRRFTSQMDGKSSNEFFNMLML